MNNYHNKYHNRWGFEKMTEDPQLIPQVISDWTYEAEKLQKRIERLQKRQSPTAEDRRKLQNMFMWQNCILSTIDYMNELWHRRREEKIEMKTVSVGGKAYFPADFQNIVQL